MTEHTPGATLDRVKEYRKIIILSFPSEKTGKPIVCNLVRLFDLTFNILKAQIPPRREGLMTLELWGSEENFKKGVAYLKDQGIAITDVEQKISRDEELCMQCGMCTAVCPADALHMQYPERIVGFAKSKCTACGLCARVCPVEAMILEVENGTW